MNSMSLPLYRIYCCCLNLQTPGDDHWVCHVYINKNCVITEELGSSLHTIKDGHHLQSEVDMCEGHVARNRKTICSAVESYTCL